MRDPLPAPSLVPSFDVTVYTVLDDFGRNGRAYVETDETRADLESVIKQLLTGQYRNPVRVVAFNTSEGWARDVSEDIALEVYQRATARGDALPDGSREFVQFHVGTRVGV